MNLNDILQLVNAAQAPRVFQPQSPMYTPNTVLWQGMNNMNNLGNQIGQGFATANAISSANLQQRYNAAATIDSERLRQQGQSERLQMMAPLIGSLMGGGGGGGSRGIDKINTNYGAGVSIGDGNGGDDTDPYYGRRPYYNKQGNWIGNKRKPAGTGGRWRY